MLKQKLASRKFLMAAAGALFLILNEGLALNIPEDTYWYLAGIIIAYIAGETVIDVARAKNNSQNSPGRD